MSNLQKYKRFGLIDKFNDTPRYLYEIFTINNPEFAEHIPDIYPRKRQLNATNTSDKETSFVDLKIKYEKILLPRCIHHFKSDLINKMDHMRSSSTEPSSVILNQTK